MEAIERAAFISVGRAYGFAGLAIVCIMFSFSFSPPFATLIGATLCCLAAFVLFLHALTARRRPYRRTETWLILPKENHPRAEIAQQVIGEVLRQTYLRFSRDALLIAAGLLAFSLVLRLAGVDELPLGDHAGAGHQHLPTHPLSGDPASVVEWRLRAYP